jgi:Flp pilus assembly protein TadD
MSYSASRACIILALAFIASYVVLAQRSTRPVAVEVHGQVRIAQGGSSAENVLVRLESFRGGLVGEVRTDRLGKFRFSGLVPDQYVVSVHTPGFKDTQQQVDLQTASSEYVQLQLVPDKSAPPGATPSRTGTINANVPTEARDEYEKGVTALLAGGKKEKLEEAARHLERAVNLHPDFFEAQLELGTVYMDLKRWDKAEVALRRATEIDSKSANALFALGEAQRRQKKYAEAEKSLQKGITLDEKSWQGHFNLGHVYWDIGDWAKAGPHIGRALQLKPDFAEGHLLAGNILLKARQAQNAMVEFQEYLRLSPQGEYASEARALVEKIKVALSKNQ